uniref:CSON014102 protein n=1 Tax=Culicoides sonorensis TaxID=179676 RepID=A0A336MAG1_CULSO
MENLEINSNQRHKTDKEKTNPEVNNNRSTENFPKEIIGSININSDSKGGRVTSNGALNCQCLERETEMQKSEDLNGKCSRLEAGPGRIDENSIEYDDDDDHVRPNSSHSDEEELVEEIILLPNNFISDDELSSNSDDCVYAYRGGHNNNMEPILIPEPVNIGDDGQDDETDFLEMDFDPEPNSEIENFMEDEHHFNHLEANFFTLRSEEGLRDLPCVSHLRQNESEPTLDIYQKTLDEASSTVTKDCEEDKTVSNSDNVYTGAKPKLVISNSAHKISSSTSYSKEPYESDSNRISNNSPSIISNNKINEDHLSCLECAETEIIMQTKSDAFVERKCQKHRRNVPSISYSSTTQSESVTSLQSSVIHQELLPHTTSKTQSIVNPESIKECMVTIYSVNCDFETIVEATNLIGVTLNTEILQQYFDNLLDEDTATMSIPEYLLYISKRNCNYKRLIDVIRAASVDTIDIHFYPHDLNSMSPDVVQISTSEITQRWNRNTNLRQILMFKNKNFKSLNILGKVVTVIRQFECGDRLKLSSSKLNIPQYYRSGYICITKLAKSASIACS